MIDFLLRTVVRWLLQFRYKIEFIGTEQIAAKGKHGILFLPNHPALIDPVVLFAYLYHEFRPHAIGDRDQVDRFVIRWFAKRLGVRTIGAMVTYGSAARNEIERVLDECADGLKQGENLLLWPAGHVYRSHLENLGGNSSVERILRHYPDVRIVLMRTKGLWGSRFSWASGHAPNVAKTLSKGFWQLLASGFFFVPKRQISIEFYEPLDLPRNADRNTLNRFLESYYNENAPQAEYVPHTIWERGSVVIAEPELPKLTGDKAAVPETTRRMVLDYISKLSGVSNPKDSDHLARDLGMDSLARTDLILWLEKEFGFPQADADAMETVGDCLLAACGQFVFLKSVELKPIEQRWFAGISKNKITIPVAGTVTGIFLKLAAKATSKVIIADQTSGTKSFRQIITACLVLKPAIEKLEGDCVGIMLPASVVADITYLATLFAGKTPVMVNWTGGQRNIVESLDLVSIRHVLTSQILVQRLASQGTDLSAIGQRFVFLESLAKSISKTNKLKAWLGGCFNWGSLYRAKISNTAAILFTSGSETVPKAVPLTHKNIISNLRDVLSVITVYEDDRLVGFLPPFHSFGLTCTMLVPLCGGVPTVYHSNPMEAGLIGRLIEAYRVTMLIGTPTFLGGIVRASKKQQLSSLRLAVTGAESCPEKIYSALKENCANAVILEGYGVTECSPIISLNDENDPWPFTIGKVLPSLEYLLVDPENGNPLAAPATGILFVQGPSVFGGYLNYKGPSPFAEVNGKKWYRTGDLVNVDEEGVLTFRGRLKRFVKLGGEMISLPAIEAVLEKCFVNEKDEGPVMAVDAIGEETPELVLFTIRDIDRETVNRCIREAGLSGLHNIRRIIKLEAIPTLGTGKTDYRALKKMLMASA